MPTHVALSSTIPFVTPLALLLVLLPLPPQSVLVVVSANKIVATVAEANARADDWALHVESARVRVAYKVGRGCIPVLALHIACNQVIMHV